MTNGDRIRQMTDEDLAEIVQFDDCFGPHYKCPGWKQDHNCDCKECFLMWLKQEVNEDAGSKTD